MEVLKALYNWRTSAYKTWVKIHVCKKLKVHDIYFRGDITKSANEKWTATLEVISQSQWLKNAQLLRGDITKHATEKRTAT